MIKLIFAGLLFMAVLVGIFKAVVSLAFESSGTEDDDE